MAAHRATVCFESPIGNIEVQAAAEGVTRVRLESGGAPREVGEAGALAVARRARAEILDYLAGFRRAFTVPLKPHGTPFQRSVWSVLEAIPYGATVSYGAVAERLGKPRAARAVGAACRANPLPILVPCHRVVGGDGSPTGFAAGVAMKVSLLDLESSGAVVAAAVAS